MRLVIQRVRHASVTVYDDGHQYEQDHISYHAGIGQGLLVLVGVEETDAHDDIEWLVGKVSRMRIFDDSAGIMNVSVQDIGGDILAISQFTLFASTKKGNRPSWLRAAKGPVSEPLYDAFCQQLSAALGHEVQRGVFGADMKVELLNDGPVTIIIDSKNRE